MKLYPDCVRSILLEVESCSLNEYRTVDELESAITSFTKEDIIYTCIKLKEAGFINAQIINTVTEESPVVKGVQSLTYAGHAFLDNIKSDTVFDNAKAVASKIGSVSINGLSQIATGVVSALIKSQLGL